jgi:hypothetical protein
MQRIQPDRTGYTGYSTCEGITLYELDCQCCNVDDELCVEEYLNIPARPAISTISAPWNQNHNTYITEGPSVPGTSRNIWIVTEPTEFLTPFVCCKPNESSDYNFLETEYIDVPPIRTRGLSYPSPVSVLKSFSPKTCIKCYDVEVSPGNGTSITYTPSGASPNPVDAPTDAHGGVLPTTLDRSEVADSYFEEGEQCDEVTFIYCAPSIENALKPEDQCSTTYLQFSYAQDAGAGGEDPFYRRIGFNVEGIPVGDGSTVTHVLAKDSSDCLYWVAVTDCPT